MTTIFKTALLTMPLLVITACVTTPEPVEVVEITPPPIEQTCYPIAALQKVVVSRRNKKRV